MQISPLQLEDYNLKNLRFALISPLKEVLDPGIIYDGLDIEVNATTEQRGSDPLSWRCELQIRSRDEKPGKDEKPGNYPYTFELLYVGFFRVVKEFPMERVEQMVRVNAPALLYSAAREALLYLTGRGRVPAILIPSITFIEPPTSQPHPVAAGKSRAGKSASKKAASKKK